MVTAAITISVSRRGKQRGQAPCLLILFIKTLIVLNLQSMTQPSYQSNEHQNLNSTFIQAIKCFAFGEKLEEQTVSLKYLQELLYKGAHVNAQGGLALYYAYINHSMGERDHCLNLLEFLLARGANPRLKVAEGKSVLDLAYRQRNTTQTAIKNCDKDGFTQGIVWYKDYLKLIHTIIKLLKEDPQKHREAQRKKRPRLTSTEKNEFYLRQQERLKNVLSTIPLAQDLSFLSSLQRERPYESATPHTFKKLVNNLLSFLEWNQE